MYFFCVFFFSNKIVSRYFTETQSLTSNNSNSGRKNSTLPGNNLEQDQADGQRGRGRRKEKSKEGRRVERRGGDAPMNHQGDRNLSVDHVSMAA